MKNLLLRFLFLIVGMSFFSCSADKKEIYPEGNVSTVLPDVKNDVTVMDLKKDCFTHELISNGKVMAYNIADLYFSSSEVVAHIWVKNGDHVKKGQRIAELDKSRLDNRLALSKDALERSKLELQDVLIGQGYGLDETDKIPPEIMQLAYVRSGYEQSRLQYELAQHEFRNATLVAPFDGVVANLFVKSYNMISTSEVFCSIIDPYGMEVDFTVLESELILIKRGDRVEIIPYFEPSFKFNGSITEINPVVDSNGMVRIRARIDNNSKLFTGMNVKVSVHRSLNEQLIIPKTAVVLRSGKQVVFTLKEGKAYWNYVQTGLENASHYTIIDGLQEGEVVIITGNDGRCSIMRQALLGYDKLADSSSPLCS